MNNRLIYLLTSQSPLLFCPPLIVIPSSFQVSIIPIKEENFSIALVTLTLNTSGQIEKDYTDYNRW